MANGYIYARNSTSTGNAGIGIEAAADFRTGPWVGVRSSGAFIEWNGATWVAAGGSGTYAIYTSTDGLHWTGRPSPMDSLPSNQSGGVFGITWTGSVWVVIGRWVENGNNRWVATSPNGITWTTRPTPVDNYTLVLGGTVNTIGGAGGGGVSIGTSGSSIVIGGVYNVLDSQSGLTVYGVPVLLRSTDNGVTWTQSTIQAEPSFEVTNPNDSTFVNNLGNWTAVTNGAYVTVARDPAGAPVPEAGSHIMGVTASSIVPGSTFVSSYTVECGGYGWNGHYTADVWVYAPAANSVGPLQATFGIKGDSGSPVVTNLTTGWNHLTTTALREGSGVDLTIQPQAANTYFANGDAFYVSNFHISIQSPGPAHPGGPTEPNVIAYGGGRYLTTLSGQRCVMWESTDDGRTFVGQPNTPFDIPIVMGSPGGSTAAVGAGSAGSEGLTWNGSKWICSYLPNSGAGAYVAQNVMSSQTGAGGSWTGISTHFDNTIGSAAQNFTGQVYWLNNVWIVEGTNYSDSSATAVYLIYSTDNGVTWQNHLNAGDPFIPVWIGYGPIPTGPTNDDIANATLIGGYTGSIEGTLDAATWETYEYDVQGPRGGSVWYRYVGPCRGILTGWVDVPASCPVPAAVWATPWVVSPHKTPTTNSMSPAFVPEWAALVNASFNPGSTWSGGGFDFANSAAYNPPHDLYIAINSSADNNGSFTFGWALNPLDVGLDTIRGGATPTDSSARVARLGTTVIPAVTPAAASEGATPAKSAPPFAGSKALVTTLNPVPNESKPCQLIYGNEISHSLEMVNRPIVLGWTPEDGPFVYGALSDDGYFGQQDDFYDIESNIQMFASGDTRHGVSGLVMVGMRQQEHVPNPIGLNARAARTDGSWDVLSNPVTDGSDQVNPTLSNPPSKDAFQSTDSLNNFYVYSVFAYPDGGAETSYSNGDSLTQGGTTKTARVSLSISSDMALTGSQCLKITNTGTATLGYVVIMPNPNSGPTMSTSASSVDSSEYMATGVFRYPSAPTGAFGNAFVHWTDPSDTIGSVLNPLSTNSSSNLQNKATWVANRYSDYPPFNRTVQNDPTKMWGDKAQVALAVGAKSFSTGYWAPGTSIYVGIVALTRDTFNDNVPVLMSMVADKNDTPTLAHSLLPDTNENIFYPSNFYYSAQRDCYYVLGTGPNKSDFIWQLDTSLNLMQRISTYPSGLGRPNSNYWTVLDPTTGHHLVYLTNANPITFGFTDIDTMSRSTITTGTTMSNVDSVLVSPSTGYLVVWNQFMSSANPQKAGLIINVFDRGGNLVHSWTLDNLIQPVVAGDLSYFGVNGMWMDYTGDYVWLLDYANLQGVSTNTYHRAARFYRISITNGPTLTNGVLQPTFVVSYDYVNGSAPWLQNPDLSPAPQSDFSRSRDERYFLPYFMDAGRFVPSANQFPSVAAVIPRGVALVADHAQRVSRR